MARSKSSAAARFSAIFRRNPRAKREKLPAVDIGYSLGPGCCQQRPRVRSLIPDSASRLALDEPQSRDASTSVLSRRGCGDRKQGRLLDRALRGALSLKPGVSSLLKLRKASTRVSNLVSRRSVLRTRPQRERDRKFADSARSQFEATQEEVQPASARDFSMSRENPAISCSFLTIRCQRPESHRSRYYMRNCFLCRRPMERCSRGTDGSQGGAAVLGQEVRESGSGSSAYFRPSRQARRRSGRRRSCGGAAADLHSRRNCHEHP